eukprot:COSAG06_NODE_446_length_15654_cov_8.176278_2_plen_92_part_00
MRRTSSTSFTRYACHAGLSMHLAYFESNHNVNRICTLIIISYHGSHHKVNTQGLCCLRYYRTVMNGQVEYSNEPDDHDFGLLYQVSQRTES